MTSPLRALARRLGVALVLPLLLGSGLVVAAPSAEAAAPNAARVAAYESRVISLINAIRVKNHRGGLRASPCVDRFAERWGLYLGNTGRFYHQQLTPLLRGCTATRAAENLARGNVSEDRIVAMWMASPGHKANILDGRLNQIGVAAVYAHGRWTVTADFTRA